MQLITDFINTGKAKSFDDIVKEHMTKKAAAEQKTIKVASAEATVKVAEQDEAASSGQLAVEPLHQTGESATMPKNGPSAKTEGKETGKAKSSGDAEAEGKDSGQTKAEGSEKLTNDPKVEASEEAEVKEAGIKGNCEKCSKPNFLCKCDKSDSADSEKSDDSDDSKEEKECSAATACDKCECDPCECDVEASVTEEKAKEAAIEATTDEEIKQAATVVTRFMKVANLDDKTEAWLRTFWDKIYPKAYVDAMLAKK